MSTVRCGRCSGEAKIYPTSDGRGMCICPRCSGPLAALAPLGGQTVIDGVRRIEVYRALAAVGARPEPAAGDPIITGRTFAAAADHEPEIPDSTRTVQSTIAAAGAGACEHPPAACYTWQPPDPGPPVIACCVCGVVLQGAADPAYAMSAADAAGHEAWLRGMACCPECGSRGGVHNATCDLGAAAGDKVLIVTAPNEAQRHHGS